MTEENEPHRRDEEAFSTHARTIAKACQYQTGPPIKRWMSENSHKDVYAGKRTVKPNRGFSDAAPHRQIWYNAKCCLNFSGPISQPPARLPKKSLTLVKKTAASGWVAPEESFSNSASSSCCFLVRFCGVSTTT